MFEGLKDMGKLLKQAKEMKAKMKQVQDELKTIKVSGTFEGKCEVILTGELELVQLTIDPSLLNPNDGKRLEKGLTKAFNEAVKKAKDAATSKLSTVTGGLNLPGLTG